MLPGLAAAALADRHAHRVAAVELHPGEEALRAQLAGTVVDVAPEGTEVGADGQLVVLEAMKMQHVQTAPDALRTVRNLVSPGQVVATGDPLLVFTRTNVVNGESSTATVDLDRTRVDLDLVWQRHRLTLDEGREAAVAKRHKQGRRTARENIADLVDPGSFVEYGALAIAAQRSRRSEEDLIANTPADGLVAGVATIGADRFGLAAARAVVVSYDYTVLAGTQGMRNHAKTDRVFDLAVRNRLPVVLVRRGRWGPARRHRLCDTPGFMVGPDAEKEATVRRFGRMFIVGARLTVPLGMIIVRKGVWVGCDGHGRWLLPCAGVHGRLAHRGDRRHGAGRGGAARVPQGAGRSRGRG
ncbi:hypothetical protein MGAST_12570 [Mycobacterium gastri 'Wayne']|nr:hypothetical protein MGAST_12570 [Mycobacterium gastri 'Wayne']